MHLTKWQQNSREETSWKPQKTFIRAAVLFDCHVCSFLAYCITYATPYHKEWFILLFFIWAVGLSYFCCQKKTPKANPTATKEQLAFNLNGRQRCDIAARCKQMFVHAAAESSLGKSTAKMNFALLACLCSRERDEGKNNVFVVWLQKHYISAFICW